MVEGERHAEQGGEMRGRGEGLVVWRGGVRIPVVGGEEGCGNLVFIWRGGCCSRTWDEGDVMFRGRRE